MYLEGTLCSIFFLCIPQAHYVSEVSFTFLRSVKLSIKFSLFVGLSIILHVSGLALLPSLMERNMLLQPSA